MSRRVSCACVSAIKGGMPQRRLPGNGERGLSPRAPRLLASGDDVRNQGIFELGDLVPEEQLALLQPRELELVRCRERPKRLDRRIEIAMLHAQPDEAAGHAHFLYVDAAHLPHAMLLKRSNWGYSEKRNGSSRKRGRPSKGRRQGHPDGRF